MDGILVYAKVRGVKQFVAICESVEGIQSVVCDELVQLGREELMYSIYFLVDGQEYKLFLEDDE